MDILTKLNTGIWEEVGTWSSRYYKPMNSIRRAWSAYNRRIISIAPPKKRNQYDIIDLKRTKYLINCLNKARHKLQKGRSVDQLWHHRCKETG